MKSKKIIISIIVLLFLIVTILFLIINFYNRNYLTVDFFDVGQGDSILISESGYQILIDSGKDGKLIKEKLGRNIPFWDKNIELVIATHPDADHIGGFEDILNSYNIQYFIESPKEGESKMAESLQQQIEQQKIIKIIGDDSYEINLPSGGKLKIISPFKEAMNFKDTNEASIVAELQYGKNTFLFTGDLPSEKESELLKKYSQDVDVLKVGHHGSKYSSSEEFLKVIKPEYAIISAGKNNSYGHPHKEALDRLKKIGAQILTTFEMDDIEFKCSLEKCEVK